MRPETFATTFSLAARVSRSADHCAREELVSAGFPKWSSTKREVLRVRARSATRGSCQGRTTTSNGTPAAVNAFSPRRDGGPGEPCVVCFHRGHVTDSDELASAWSGPQGLELERHITLEVQPADDAHDGRERLSPCEEVERLAEGVHALDDDAAANRRLAQLADSIAGREVAVDDGHRYGIDPGLGVQVAFPYMQVRVNQLSGHDRCQTSCMARQRLALGTVLSERGLAWVRESPPLP